jgi:glycosyltransferase involved in cell wall biosynthesis
VTESKHVLLYDYLFSKGGAEKLSMTLVEGVHGCDLIVGLKDDQLFPQENLQNGGGKLKVLASYSDKKGWKTLKVMLAYLFAAPKLTQYDCAVYSGEYAPMGILRRRARATRNILYCHTIPRAPYDLYQFKLQRFTGINRFLFKILVFFIKSLYGPAIGRMDLIIANSQNVQKRIKTHLGLDSVVVNPPIDTQRFEWISQGDYYLSTARLEPAKRVDMIIEAFKQMPQKKLIVASGGSEFEALKLQAADFDNITLTNWTSDEQLHGLVGSCIATIYIPVDEDFGMSPLESMAAGKPCIGVAEGGLLETMLPEQNGWFIDAANPASIKAAVSAATPERCLKMRDFCEQHASNYSSSVFISNMKALMKP